MLQILTGTGVAKGVRPEPPAELLARAERAGLTVEAHGDQLKVRGPREHQALGLLLLARKVEVIATLAERSQPAPWDAARAAAVLSECDRLTVAALPSLTPAQRNVVDWSLRGLARCLADKRDPLLWTTPDFLREQLARWGRTPAPTP